VALALTELHPSIIHRDLRPANLLLDGGGKVNLINLGHAVDLSKQSATEPCISYGDSRYVAPELFNDQLSIKGDIYALGATLLEMASGEVPFKVPRIITTVLFSIVVVPLFSAPLVFVYFLDIFHLPLAGDIRHLEKTDLT
jgi:serine/threonine protein kinase